MPELRAYQHAAIEQLDAAITAGARAPLLVLPTGSGKTVIAAELIRRAQTKQCLFLAPRRELVFQTCAKLDDCGVGHGVLLAGADDRRCLWSNVQVASIDTLIARMIHRQRLHLPHFDVVIVDEAHLSITPARKLLLDLWPDALRIGLTATPTRKDGRALGMLFDRLVEPITTATLTNLGYLAPARYFSVARPKLDGISVVAGDYDAAQLDAAMNTSKLVGDVVEHWLSHAGDRRTVVFCASVPHSVAVAEQFQRAGVAAEHVDAKTPPERRAETFARFRSGATQILTNCFLASYGFDLPALSCVVLARPTKSLMLYLQMIGRGLRIADSKRDCLILDHSGCVHLHGFAHDERQWTLEGEHALVPREEPASSKEREGAKRIECPECSAIFSGTRTCPECDYYLAPRGKMVETLDGQLVEVGAPLRPETQDRLKFYLELRGIAQERSWKPNAAKLKFKAKFGYEPPPSWNDHPPARASAVTRRWLQSRNIAWRKAGGYR